MKVILGILLFISGIGGCNYGIYSTENVEWVKERAPKYFNDNGYKILAYEGYQGTHSYFAGGRVWYQISRKDNPNIIYNCYLERWKDEVHLYRITPMNIVTGIKLTN